MKNILIIEDDVALRENTGELLELSGYHVLLAPDGKAGIEVAKAKIPDLIICDIMMPEIDGYEVLETLTLNEKTQWIPFIFMSAKTEYSEVRKGMNMGADDYLTKPFEEEELLKTVKSRLSKAELLTTKLNKESAVSEHQGPENLDQLKEFFKQNGRAKIFAKEEVIFEQGNHSNFLYFISNGVVKTHKINDDGKELITGLFKDDSFFGFTSLLDNIPFAESATTVEKSKVIRLAKNDLKEILQKGGNVSLEMMNLLTNNLEEVKTQLLQMAYDSVKRKTAKTILRFAEVHRAREQGSIRISRNDLAANAGIATESLIRALADFKKDHLIANEGRTIKIIDLEGLKKY